VTSKAAILLSALGAINVGLACFFVVTVVSDHRGDEPREPSATSQVAKRSSDRAARVSTAGDSCPHQRPVVVPRVLPQRADYSAGLAAICRSEVGRYQQMLEDIQSWCNPYCQDELEECKLVLTNLSSTTYPEHLPGGVELVLR
jgi:hypothetical protein